MTTPRAALYLIPTPLGETPPELVLPQSVLVTTRSLRHFVVENAKTARAFLKAVGMPVAIAELALAELNEHTSAAAIPELLAPALRGEALGLLSEAGCPAVADPGAALVAAAHRQGVAVVPLVGPSAILLGLMASGMNGQAWSFHGYLPVKPQERAEALRRLEEQAWKTGATQAFIETPYRNVALIETLLAVCRQDTRLCVATDLTLATESIRSLGVGEWKKKPLGEYAKRPAVFYLGRA